jgi:hypothetical protein
VAFSVRFAIIGGRMNTRTGIVICGPATHTPDV